MVGGGGKELAHELESMGYEKRVKEAETLASILFYTERFI